MTARSAVVKALMTIQEDGGYSNIVLDGLLESADLSASDRSLASRLLYGVTERRLTLDYLLNQTASTPVKKMQPAVREILRVGAYQLVFMDKMPAFAAINEAVELVKKYDDEKARPFVNGVLNALKNSLEEKE